MKPGVHFLLLLTTNILVSLAQNPAVQDFQIFNANFTSILYQEFKKTENGNIWLSPFSAEIIMPLLESGSRGQSAEEIRNVFHSSNTTRIKGAVKSLLRDLERNDLYTFHLANKMYLDERFLINEDFKKTSTDYYLASLEKIDFDKVDESVQTINDWVKNETRGVIQEIIGAESLENDTRLVLVNVLYFKASWSQPFYLTLTEKIHFYTRVEVLEVDALQNTYGQLFLYQESEELECKFLDLPFKGDDASMTIILPDERDGLFNLENQIRTILLEQDFTLERVDVAIPKFKFENNIDLMRIFKDLGVTQIFDASQADLSGIAGEKGDLVINRLVQKSFIEVNEEGVQAAAATSLSVLQPKSIFMEPPKEFVADHPFIFYIRVKGIIVFVGRVIDPSKM